MGHTASPFSLGKKNSLFERKPMGKVGLLRVQRVCLSHYCILCVAIYSLRLQFVPI